ncbi:MAG: TonB-dependent receptor plug domain-containing protein, partial [Gammaproteobacteria bacterium]
MFRRHPLASAVSAALGTASAIAIPVGAFAEDGASIEEVVVTGSRIVKPDYVSTSPVTTITSEQLEAINTINLESELRQLPQFLPGATEFINNGNPGAATVNLRGLGSNRTLVLMDGKRLPPYGTSGSVDINLIPAALIERVDVVTGGASAVYGSDAVAGVVNFITKSDFEGLQVDADVSEYEEGDGRTESYAITGGGLFGDNRGSAVVSFSYTQRDPVLQGDRKYSNYNIAATDGYVYNGVLYAYSDSIFGEDRRLGSSNAGATRGRVRSSTGGFLTRHFTPDGGFTSTAGLASTPYAGNQTYNYNPYNYFQVKQKRTSAYGAVTYKLTDNAEIYGRIFAINADVPTQLAPSAYFGGADPIKVNLDNPFLS